MPQSGHVGLVFLRVVCADICRSFQMSALPFFTGGAWGRSMLCAQTSHRCCSIAFASGGPPDGESVWVISVTCTVASFFWQCSQFMGSRPRSFASLKL